MNALNPSVLHLFSEWLLRPERFPSQQSAVRNGYRAGTTRRVHRCACSAARMDAPVLVDGGHWINDSLHNLRSLSRATARHGTTVLGSDLCLEGRPMRRTAPRPRCHRRPRRRPQDPRRAPASCTRSADDDHRRGRRPRDLARVEKRRGGGQRAPPNRGLCAHFGAFRHFATRACRPRAEVRLLAAAEGFRRAPRRRVSINDISDPSAPASAFNVCTVGFALPPSILLISL
jgi:hypothetical protein